MFEKEEEKEEEEEEEEEEEGRKCHRGHGLPSLMNRQSYQK